MPMALTEMRSSGPLAAIECELTGNVRLADAAPLQRSFRKWIKDGCRFLVVHLAKVNDIDRAGWNALVSVARRLQQSGGRCILLGCDDQLHAQMLPHWERCFLLPDLRAEDADSLPADLRSWLASDARPLPPISSHRPVKSSGARRHGWVAG